MKKLICGFALLISITMYAQNPFYKGFLILNNTDTIYGFIQYKDWTFNPSEINFKTDSLKNDFKVYDIVEIKGFALNGIDSYERWLCKISMDPSDINNLWNGRSELSTKKEIFLKKFTVNPSLTFYVYRDGIKERSFVKQESDSIPIELNYKFYYSGIGYTQAVKEEKYKEQLLDILSVFAPQNAKLKKEVAFLKYRSELLLKFLYKLKIDAKQQSNSNVISGSAKTKKQYFIQLGVSAFPTINNNNYYDERKSKNRITPYIGLEIDIIPDKFRGRFFISIELAYASQTFIGKKTYPLFNQVVKLEAVEKMQLISLLPSFNFKVYKSARIEIFAGLGLGISANLQNEIITVSKYYDMGTFLGESKENSPTDKSNIYGGLNAGCFIGERVKINFKQSFVSNGPISNASFSQIKFGYMF